KPGVFSFARRSPAVSDPSGPGSGPLTIQPPSSKLSMMPRFLAPKKISPTELAGDLPMQLKLKRTQRSAGLMGGKVIFGLDARADLSAEERSLVQKYALGKMVVYDSEAR